MSNPSHLLVEAPRRRALQGEEPSLWRPRSVVEASVGRLQGAVIQSQKRFRVLAAGRRFGKTQIALLELFRAVCVKGRTAWYVAPTYKQAKHIAWKRLKELT